MAVERLKDNLDINWIIEATSTPEESYINC